MGASIYIRDAIVKCRAERNGETEWNDVYNICGCQALRKLLKEGGKGR